VCKEIGIGDEWGPTPDHEGVFPVWFGWLVDSSLVRGMRAG